MEQVYGVWAVRSAASMFGHAEAWCKEDGRPLEFESLEAAQAYALELNRKATANVRYFVKEKEPEPSAVRVPASQPGISLCFSATSFLGTRSTGPTASISGCEAGTLTALGSGSFSLTK